MGECLLVYECRALNQYGEQKDALDKKGAPEGLFIIAHMYLYGDIVYFHHRKPFFSTYTIVQ